MKVELLVNLKISNGKIIPAGTIYTDDKEPIPEFIFRRLKRGMAREIKDIPQTSLSFSDVTGSEETFLLETAPKRRSKKQPKKIIKKKE